MKHLICITCPKGCHLQVDENKDYAVTGNNCPRGAEYGRNELLHPVRVLTSTVRITGAAIPRLPVKTDKPLPKERMFDCMELINGLLVQSPVQVGQVLAEDLFGTGVNLVACKTL
ncbi:MAG: DUF1667 domain-containing protein [Lachnospiraceae bacterium]|nr:DUF1667 domain-containing protein [Lachnospiraceae bacterium]